MRRRTRLVDVRLEPNKDDRAQIIPVGDVHLGYPTTNEKLLLDTINHCLDKKIYVIGMGDLIECGLTGSVGDSVYRQKVNPQEQIEKAIEYFMPLAKAGLLLGVHSGNHERRLMKTSGIDVTKFIATALDVRFLGHSVFHLWRVGKQSYTAFSTHGSSGARLPHSKIRAALDVFRYVDSEIVLHAHLHALDHHTTLYHRVNKKRKVVEELSRHAVLTGSFMDYFNSYGEEKNLPPAKTGVAKISLRGDEHQINVSL